jgi:hypothetical protein
VARDDHLRAYSTELADIASRLVDFVVDRMSIDQDWMVASDAGVTWWAGRLAQRLTIAAIRDEDGTPVVAAHVETDLLTGVETGAPTWQRLAAINRYATLSAYVADVPAKAVRLHASVSLTRDNWPMARMLALHAMALQVADAHAEADLLADAFGAAVAASAHPERGFRHAPDEMLGVVQLYEQRGREASAFTIEELSALVQLDPRPWLTASSLPTGLVADLDFADGRPSRMELEASASHPSLGTGLQLRRLLPVEPDVALAQRLNAREVVQPDAHQLGAWCVDDTRGLLFGAFMPSAIHTPHLARALVYHAAARNEWARTVLFPEQGGRSSG